MSLAPAQQRCRCARAAGGPRNQGLGYGAGFGSRRASAHAAGRRPSPRGGRPRACLMQLIGREEFIERCATWGKGTRGGRHPDGRLETVSRPDLLDRAIIIDLPRIPDDRRRSRREFWSAFEAARPRILGALLTAVSTALQRVGEVRLHALPRWLTSPPGPMPPSRPSDSNPENSSRPHDGNRRGGPRPRARCLADRSLGTRPGEWSGTAAELLERWAESPTKRRRDRRSGLRRPEHSAPRCVESPRTSAPSASRWNSPTSASSAPVAGKSPSRTSRSSTVPIVPTVPAARSTAASCSPAPTDRSTGTMSLRPGTPEHRQGTTGTSGAIRTRFCPA